MYTSTAQCINGKIILHRHLKCDGNESHSIRMLKRHLLLNSQTHTTTTRTTLRMYHCITLYQCSKNASEHDGAELHSPLPSYSMALTAQSGRRRPKWRRSRFRLWENIQKNIHLCSKFMFKSKLALFLHPSSKSWLGKLCSFTLQSV